MSLETALDMLSAAHGPAQLAQAFARLRGTVRRERRAAAFTGGTLAQTFTAAMAIWDQDTANGVSRLDRLISLERTLRMAWPVTREWKYACKDCADYGLRMGTCPGDATCGRSKAHYAHDFGTPCWCGNGARYRDKAKPTPADFTAAGKSPAKPQRLGKW